MRTIHSWLIVPAALAALAATAMAQAPQTYRPGLGDLMTATVQPRHIKLGLAGHAQNWTYAAYELHELGEAFERAASVWPTWRQVPVGQMIQFNTKEPLDQLEAAIKAHDADRFAAAYKQLTEACDTCHRGADRGMIVIKVPEGSFFPDQDFNPRKP